MINRAHCVFSRTLFISTEDPLVLKEAEAESGRNGRHWAVIYSRIKRLHEDDAVRGTESPQDQVWKIEQPPGITMQTYLLQLLMALEADAWITTRGSNWNRIIDELRCIWVDKCAHPVVEIGNKASWYPTYSWRR